MPVNIHRLSAVTQLQQSQAATARGECDHECCTSPAKKQRPCWLSEPTMLVPDEIPRGRWLTEADDRCAADWRASWTRALALVGTQASATSTLRVTSMDSLFSVWYTAVSRFTSLVQPSRLAAMLCTTPSLCLSPVNTDDRVQFSNFQLQKHQGSDDALMCRPSWATIITARHSHPKTLSLIEDTLPCRAAEQSGKNATMDCRQVSDFMTASALQRKAKTHGMQGLYVSWQLWLGISSLTLRQLIGLSMS